MQPAYITAMGLFLPGAPVPNEEMEEYLGMVGGVPSKVRPLILHQNGIRTRHYAIDRSQKTLYRNSEMAAKAVRDALSHGGIAAEHIDFIAAATTQGDLSVPGFASMVHGELKSPVCEIATLHGVCASGAMALKSAMQRVRTEPTRAAVACASELPSRLFKASRYERQVAAGGSLPFDTEFLRWMLSDGAGAAVVQSRPNPEGLSLRIDWIDIRSYANQNELCMYAGTNKGPNGEAGQSWLDYPSFEDAAAAGAINLKQDIRMLDRVINTGANGLFDLIEKGRIDPNRLDWIVCHYSSDVFRSKVIDLVKRAGIHVPNERWFSNLPTRGNVGCASIFLLLEELFNGDRLKAGQRVLALVPESGRFTHAYLMFTVVGADGAPHEDTQPALAQPAVAVAPAKRPAPSGPVIRAARGAPMARAGPPPLAETTDPVQASAVRRLTRVWLDFEARLHDVPIIRRLERGDFTLDDYRLLLLNMRQQVIEGSRWIARAASSMEGSHAALRSMVLQHAKEEHRDYEMLERDYVATGGELATIQAAPKNLGSEALSAWMFHKAGQPNPVDLLGAMFIIEGLGNRLARPWGEAVRDRLGLPESNVTFLLYHGGADEGHMGKLENVLASGMLTADLADRIVKTAKVTARLYLLQLEEVGNT